MFIIVVKINHAHDCPLRFYPPQPYKDDIHLFYNNSIIASILFIPLLKFESSTIIDQVAFSKFRDLSLSYLSEKKREYFIVRCIDF